MIFSAFDAVKKSASMHFALAGSNSLLQFSFIPQLQYLVFIGVKTLYFKLSFCFKENLEKPQSATIIIERGAFRHLIIQNKLADKCSNPCHDNSLYMLQLLVLKICKTTIYRFKKYEVEKKKQV